MGEYEKYYRFNEYIESLGLDLEAVKHYRADEMFERLLAVREKEERGSLNDEDLREKKTVMGALDSFIEEFVQGKRNEIEAEITKFKQNASAWEEKISKVKSSFVLDSEIDLGVNGVIRELENDLNELIAEADELIREVDAFRSAVSGYTDVEFTTNYSEIKATVASFKARLRELKKHQIDIYNSRVIAINEEIFKFQNMRGQLSEDIWAKVSMLTVLSVYSNESITWNHHNYIDKLDYGKMLEINILLVEIQRLIEKEKEEDKENDDDKSKVPPVHTIDLESSIMWIEKRVSELEGKIKPDMSQEDIHQLNVEISYVANRIAEFDVKLHNNKDKISEEKFNEYFDRLNDAQANLAGLDSKLKLGRQPVPPVPPVDNTSAYKELMEKLELLGTEVNNFSSLVEALYGEITEVAVERLGTYLDTFEGRLETIKAEIEKSYSEGKLDQNQYENLNKKVEEIENVLKETKIKSKEPEMVKDVDIFIYLNGQIDGLEKALDELETQVEALEKPIKDKNTRKQIDKIIKKIEEEIKYLETILEKHKEDNPEKYEATKQRLDGVKDRLDKVSKKYRSKCPLLVRAVKSAKDFFKKHKKIALIIAGLAAIALIHATVGPILIPAIMHGNIMIANTTPALRGFIKFANNILGGMIGATRNIDGVWTLANGVAINSSLSSVSLLKGLAISGIGTAVMVAPVVVAVKTLIEKMKTGELKTKLKEEQEKHKKKKKEKEDNTNKKDKKDKKDKKTKKADKMTFDELAEIIKEFRESGKSLDEYCEEKGFSEEEKAIIQYLDAKSKENEESLKNSGRKGRR